MRVVMLKTLVMLVALGLSGCAANLSQTASPDGAGQDPGAGTSPDGRGADLETGMSPAVQALLEQGRQQRDAGEYSRASASLERALRIESGEPQVWLEMGWLRFDEGNFAQAEQMGRKVLSLVPVGSAVGVAALRLIDEARFGLGG